MRTRSLFTATAIALAALFLAACGGSSRALVNAASRDLRCPRRNIRVVALEHNVRGVIACNQRATYTRNCGRGRCQWTQDMRYMTLWR